MSEPSDTERSEWPEATEAYVAELEAKVERLETAITTAIGRIDNLNDFGDIREVLEWALENFVASGVHTCSQTCKRPLCVLRRENRALCQRLHMAEEQIRECRQYLRLDDRKLAVGHIDAYFKLPAIDQATKPLAEAVTTDNTKINAWLLEENAQLREIDRLAGEADMTAVDMGDVVWVRAEEWFALHKALEEGE